MTTKNKQKVYCDECEWFQNSWKSMIDGYRYPQTCYHKSNNKSTHLKQGWLPDKEPCDKNKKILEKFDGKNFLRK